MIKVEPGGPRIQPLAGSIFKRCRHVSGQRVMMVAYYGGRSSRARASAVLEGSDRKPILTDKALGGPDDSSRVCGQADVWSAPEVGK